jgi:uncharacterized protein (TIGR01777 family)
MKALVTGATGFIGRGIVASLPHPNVLSRDPERARRELGAVDSHPWSPAAEPPPAEAFEGVDTVFHLAGDPVAAGRWNAAKKKRMRESRVLGTRHLVEALGSIRERPRVLVAASAVGYYGDRGDETLDEGSAPGKGFLADLCVDWEAEAMKAAGLGMRVVMIRIGVVLGASGGALAKMLLPFKFGAGGRLGSGRQWMAWIHVEDLVALFLFAAGTKGVSGPINGVAPVPVTNAEFTRTLGGILRRPAVLPAPGSMLRLALGEFADVLLGSQRVLPAAAEMAGYTFRHPRLEGALREILGR